MIYRETPLLAAPPVDWATQTRKFIKSRSPKTPYSADDVDAIVWSYVEVCRAGAVDLGFVLTQMVHETDSLRSMWSQPPRRNPAGIGVTGASGPDGQPLGQWFDTWLDAVEAHVGLILAYRFPAGQGSAEQQRLVNEILSFRPNVPRAVGTTVGALGDKWAADPQYVPKLAAVAQAIANA